MTNGLRRRRGSTELEATAGITQASPMTNGLRRRRGSTELEATAGITQASPMTNGLRRNRSTKVQASPSTFHRMSRRFRWTRGNAVRRSDTPSSGEVYHVVQCRNDSLALQY
ncbi:uncharacterized protein MYCFIDRAFT_89253 [Pseudocercospora fijiensis CIRAD86]|uniref:Uncharacterized protein n=1 Tax=Pseudocercospora fijiensis (strain CIRAD86) TaxID=383855 RepID=M2ZEA1_PSEFD|nr:uncharacterized protein MYCFIDRAFT_89253 [Pseudocercospora fijiensis CIRAD86]EME77459.1 hypothetical protein MYCFIDRAFT_89253 [Pseudocercospora fijiensis CIRAD86]